MKRFALGALAFSMFAAPALQAQAAPVYLPQINTIQSDAAQVDYRRDGHKRVDSRKKVVTKKMVRESHWKRGHKYRDWKRHRAVNDWHRHGLRRPDRGQEWIRVGNDYLLVGIASGIIAGIIAGR